jgi:hypothetical protein
MSTKSSYAVFWALFLLHGATTWCPRAHKGGIKVPKALYFDVMFRSFFVTFRSQGASRAHRVSPHGLQIPKRTQNAPSKHKSTPKSYIQETTSHRTLSYPCKKTAETKHDS